MHGHRQVVVRAGTVVDVASPTAVNIGTSLTGDVTIGSPSNELVVGASVGKDLLQFFLCFSLLGYMFTHAGLVLLLQTTMTRNVEMMSTVIVHGALSAASTLSVSNALSANGGLSTSSVTSSSGNLSLQASTNVLDLGAVGSSFTLGRPVQPGPATTTDFVIQGQRSLVGAGGPLLSVVSSDDCFHCLVVGVVFVIML